MSRKTLNIITIVLFIVSIIVGIFTLINASAIGNDDSGLLNPMYYWTLLLFIATVVLVFIMPLPAMLKNPKSLKRTLFVVAGIIVAFGVVYILSQGKPDGEKIMNTLSAIQKEKYAKSFFVANMNIIAAEIALALAVAAILWSALKGVVKK